MFYEDYPKLGSEIDNIGDAAKDKGLAKFGDELINFCFSLAKSIYINQCTGVKVSAKILTKAMKNSDLRHYAKLRAKAHDIADAAEAIIAYSFLTRIISLEEITNKLLEGFNKNFETDVTDIDVDTSALTELLSYLKNLLIDKKNIGK